MKNVEIKTEGSKMIITMMVPIWKY